MSEFTKMKITLDFYNKNIVSVSAKQYDNQSRYIEISCAENGKAFLADKNTMSAYIRYRKPDGLGCFNDCEITDEGNILVELTEQMLSAQGKAEADIMLLEKVFTSGEKPTDIEDIYEIHAPVISVMSFYVNIAPTALNHAQIESSYEFNALSNALSQIDYNNKKVEALDKELTENENERKTAETARVNAENTRKTNETVRINAENIRKAAETERKDNEAVRQSNETTRQTQENKRQTDTATAISNANAAAQNANNKANDLQNKLDSHHFVLTEDKDVAGGVAGLDSNAKVPISELYDASTTSKGIVQLTNSVASTSTTTAATPNSVKVAYDKTLSVETALNNEITRATAAENAKANIANPTFTGTPKAPTAAAGTNSTQIATTAFVQTAVSSGIAASDAMIVKGTIGTNGTVTALPTTYKTGWTYRVTSAGTYAGQVCEIGDLIIALVDRNGSGNTNSDWCVAQTNINGAITGVKSGDAYIQASQTGSVVTITHKDVAATNTTSSVSPAHGGKFTAVKAVTRDAKGHITGVDTETVTLPAEPNQNAFSNVAVGNTTIAADSKTDTLTFAAGRNTTLTPDANNDKITVSLADKCTTITDWNLATANGWYLGRRADNSPSEVVEWWYGLVIAHSTTYVRQILYRFGTDNNVSGNNSDRYERIMQNGVWGTWVNTSVRTAVPKNAKFTDTTYSNATTTTSGLMSANDKLKLDYTNIAYGTCSTAAATSAKVITLSGNTKWTLQKGSVVIVKFTNTNTASSVTLNVNNTGAKRIWVDRAVYTGTSAQYCGYANRNLIYVYDGTYWVWIFGGYDSNTTYSNATLGQGYGTCTTAEATTAKVVTLSSYNLVVGGIVAVKFTYAVPANSTMNINSRGAKAIYYRGAAISAGIIKAGDIGVFIYNGTQYHLLSVDRNDSSQTVGNGTITITQNGTTKGTFTTNQSGNTTIALTDNNTTYSNMKGATASAAGKAGLVPAPAKGYTTRFLRGDGTWQTPPNTWRGIEDNLTSTSTTKSLSANQGRILKSLIPSSAYKLIYALQRTGTSGNGTVITTYTPDYWYTTIGNIRILAMNIPVFNIPVNSTKTITVVLPIAFSNNSYYISISMNLGGNLYSPTSNNYAYCYSQTNSTLKIGVNTNDVGGSYGEATDFLSVLCIGIA